MPAGSYHLSVAKIVNKELHQDEYVFNIASIAPDCWRHSKFHSDKHTSHFSIPYEMNGLNVFIEDYKTFYNKYKNNLDDPFVLGYLIHLMTDFYYKENVTSRYQFKIDGVKKIKTKDGYFEGTNEEIKEYLHNQNAIATAKIAKHFNVDVIGLDKVIECFVDEIDLSGLINTINYINEANFKVFTSESEIYEDDDLFNDVINCSKFILEELENLKK